ncbi:MAG: hypothetical protein H7338_23850 [Candidatus Sericytochromatia bacterium]|nr:hypothetical protein [Candidatus Sericytochromatia bacterium]
MDRLNLVNVPVKIFGTNSPAYVASIEAAARQTLDLPGLVRGAAKYGETWLDGEMAGMDRTFGPVYARVQLEGGKMVLHALAGQAVVGRPLQTFHLNLEDGRVSGIRGGGDRGE